MVKRLLFDGIDLDGCGAAISQLEQAPFFYFADETKTGLAFTDVTVPRAEITMDLPIVHRLPPAGFVDLFSGQLHDSCLHFIALAVKVLRSKIGAGLYRSDQKRMWAAAFRLTPTVQGDFRFAYVQLDAARVKR